MDLGLEALTRASANGRMEHRPDFFRLSLPEERERLRDLLKREPGIQVHDELHSQLRELVRALNPSIRFSKTDLDQAAIDHLKGIAPEEYGVWVHYPWNGRLVHLLDEAEFALVRTDRNRNKITREEQATLATKKIGVIGLSVGQSICLTLALERGFGELRIADHDTLDLSNLNRIRSGVHALGGLKATNVAREIAEIDPFLRVTVFSDGIGRSNIERFILDGGKLDVLVDECDSVDIKILCRQYAKANRIPVVMDTSDRGMLDVERFDLESDRPVLHGLVEHLDLNAAGNAKTNEEKLPFVLPILNIDTLSKRMKASMLEIESSVTTWPQLASSVMLGGALGTDVVRRMLLGHFNESGRWFVDIEEQVRDGGTEDKSSPVSLLNEVAPLTVERMAAMVVGLPPAEGDGLTIAEAAAFAESGTWAPSAGNLQPWRFYFEKGRLFVFHDASVGDSALDGARLIPALDMGACIENMSLQALSGGCPAIRVTGFPQPENSSLVAIIDRDDGPAAQPDPLFAHIRSRCSNRRKGDGRALPIEFVLDLQEVARSIPGSAVHVVHERSSMDRMAEIIGEAERIRVLNPIGHEELFKKEFRWSAEEVLRSRDGLDLPSMELKASEEVAFRVAADRKTMDLLSDWNAGKGFLKLAKDNIASASGIMVISTEGTDRLHWLEAGRCAQRAWLKGTGLGLAVHPCAAPILLSHHVRFGSGQGFDANERERLLSLFASLKAEVGLGHLEPAFMMRLSFTSPPTARSLRKPLHEVFFQPLAANH